MTKEYIAAVDQGTTSTRFIVFDRHGQPVSIQRVRLENSFPDAGWQEQDPMDIIATVKECMQLTFDVSGIKPEQIASIGITNQRETTIVWNRRTGKPYYNAIAWCDCRTENIVETLIKDPNNSLGQDRWRDKTGLPISTYFSASKVMWLFQHCESFHYDAIHCPEDVCIGTVDTWILWSLTGEFKTDITNASRTFLFNIRSLQWDNELCETFQIPSPQLTLPQVCSNTHDFGIIRDGPYQGLHIHGCIGDQQASLLGFGCLRFGEVKNTYGTGCFLLMNTGSHLVPSHHGLLTTIGFQLGDNNCLLRDYENQIATNHLHKALAASSSTNLAGLPTLQSHLSAVMSRTGTMNKGRDEDDDDDDDDEGLDADDNNGLPCDDDNEMDSIKPLLSTLVHPQHIASSLEPNSATTPSPSTSSSSAIIPSPDQQQHHQHHHHHTAFNKALRQSQPSPPGSPQNQAMVTPDDDGDEFPSLSTPRHARNHTTSSQMNSTHVKHHIFPHLEGAGTRSVDGVNDFLDDGSLSQYSAKDPSRLQTFHVGSVSYALEGSVASCGSLISWVTRNLCIAKDAQEVSRYALEVPDNANLVIVPAFTGLFAPYWCLDARGLIIGLTRYSTNKHICRAVFECIAMQNRDVVEAMIRDINRVVEDYQRERQRLLTVGLIDDIEQQQQQQQQQHQQHDTTNDDDRRPTDTILVPGVQPTITSRDDQVTVTTTTLRRPESHFDLSRTATAVASPEAPLRSLSILQSSQSSVRDDASFHIGNFLHDGSISSTSISQDLPDSTPAGLLRTIQVSSATLADTVTAVALLDSVLYSPNASSSDQDDDDDDDNNNNNIEDHTTPSGNVTVDTLALESKHISLTANQNAAHAALQVLDDQQSTAAAAPGAAGAAGAVPDDFQDPFPETTIVQTDDGGYTTIISKHPPGRHMKQLTSSSQLAEQDVLIDPVTATATSTDQSDHPSSPQSQTISHLFPALDSLAETTSSHLHTLRPSEHSSTQIPAFVKPTTDTIPEFALPSSIISKIKVDGGVTDSDFLCAYQSDVLGIPVYRAIMQERTALGAAVAGALGAGYYSSVSEAEEALWTSRQSSSPAVPTVAPEAFRPSRSRHGFYIYLPNHKGRAYHHDLSVKKWKLAVNKSRGWASITVDTDESI